MSKDRPSAGCAALIWPGIREPPTTAACGSPGIRNAAATPDLAVSARFLSARGRPRLRARLRRSRRAAGTPFLTSTTGQRFPQKDLSRLPRRRGPRTRRGDRGVVSSQRPTRPGPPACRPHAMTQVSCRCGSGRNPGQARLLPGRAWLLPGRARVRTVPSPLPRTWPRSPAWAISPLRGSALRGPPNAQRRAHGPPAPAGVAASARCRLPCRLPCRRLHRTQAGTRGHRFVATTTRSRVRRSPPSTPRIAARTVRARAQVPSPQVPSPRAPAVAAAAATASLPRSVRITQVRRALPTGTPRPRRQHGMELHSRLLRRPTRTAAT
jgi:hypothetical protein